MQPAYSTVPMGGQQFGQPGMPQYGQPGVPQYGQPGMAPYGQPGMPQYGQPGMGQYGAQPVYKQISCGQGIDQNEFNTIVECCKQAYLSRMTPLSEHCSNGIKQRLGGDWFVFQSDIGSTEFDFHLTKVKGGDFLSFSLDNKKFEVCRIK